MNIEEQSGAVKILEDLNEPQREAVTHRGGPLMVLAGAGSGKTRVITYRIAHLLLENDARPWNILAVTFTNKAAREMRERVWKSLGKRESDLWVSTFHAASARILRGQIHHLGYERDFSIYDARDQQSLMETCIKELDLDPKRFPPRMFIARIRDAKQQFRSPEAVLSRGQSDYLDGRVGLVYQLYQGKLKKANALDFDDLLFKVLELFETQPEVLDYYRNRWTQVLVDEFQDTNSIQYRIIKNLCENHGNICVVGDDDQSIYSWRGADLGNILGFESDFPNTRVIRLEQNYRSTQTILDASGGVIEKNRHRKGKRLWTENDPGEPIQCYRAVSERDEACFVADEIRHLGDRYGFRPADMAVFYRTHAQSRVLEEELLGRNLPFAIYGGLGFYERKEIKDIIAYLRALTQPNDDVSWRRILNTPRRGIGKQTVDAVDAVAAGEGISFSKALRRFVEMKKTNPAKRVGQFLDWMDRTAGHLPKMSIEEVVRTVIEETGYIEEVQKELETRGVDRMENIQELINLVGEYESDIHEDEGPLNGFLERIALSSDIDQMDGREDRVSLMTIHAAKGLEFPVVFIVGLEERLFPHNLSMEDHVALEEERRLCYVGMTRAQKRLILSYSESRRIWGVSQYFSVSRFLKEIPNRCLESCSPGAADFGEEAEEPSSREVYAGRWVRHKAFGVGTVRRTEAGGTRIVVHFPGVGEKRFVTEMAPLEWL